MEPNYISEAEKQVCEQLLKLDQGHLISNLSSFSEEQRKEFVDQINSLNKTYPGGIESYINRAKKLLIDSANDVNPYEGFVPSVPKGKNVDFYNEQEINELEAIGIQELQHACFVLVAGGLGERLGYNGIKVSIAIELLTRKTFLQFYIEYILAFQAKSGAKSPLPLAIMVSDDTHDLTVKLLEQSNNFGMPKDQLTIMKQEKVPALLDNLAHFAQKPNSLLVDTKPHGHGDVHTLLYMTGLAKKWASEGRKWICLFQDTNPLVFRSYPAVLGVSKKCNFEVNSITIPRKPGEAVGAICYLKNEALNKNLTINVEYNQLDSLLKAFGGEPKDSNGYSLYPGNTNGLIFSLEDYLPILLETQGLISEFINPKYTDNTKTKFKSATRLECMMQDYPKLLKSGDRVGFTQIDRRFCFSTVKNDLKTAAAKVKSSLPAESSSVCEQEFYWLNKEVLRLCGVEFQVAEKPVVNTFAGLPIEQSTRVVLAPSFGVTLGEIKGKIKGKNVVHADSNLVLDGDLRIENLTLNGSLWATKDLVNVTVDNKVKLDYKEVNVEDPKVPEYLKIRGYDLEGVEHIAKL